MSAGWKTATRPHGPLQPFIIDGRTYIHLSRVYQILGEDAPIKDNTDADRLLKKLARNSEFRLDSVRIGRRRVFPEDQVLELKKRLHQHRSLKPAQPHP